MSTSRHPIRACRPVTSLTRENVFNESETLIRARTRPKIIMYVGETFIFLYLSVYPLSFLSLSLLKFPGSRIIHLFLTTLQKR